MIDGFRQQLSEFAAATHRRAAHGEAWLAETEVDELICRSGRLERRGSAQRFLAATTVWRDGQEGTATGDLTSEPGDLVDAALAVGSVLPAREPLPAVDTVESDEVRGAWPAIGADDVDRLTALSVGDAEQDVELRLRVERRTVGLIRAGSTPRVYTGGFAKLRMRIPTRSGARRGFVVEELYGQDVTDVVSRAAVGALADARATSRTLASSPVEELRYDSILLDGGVVTELMYSLATAFQLDSVKHGLSDLGERVGERLAAPGVGLLDDLNDDSSPMRTPWDDEGTVLRRTELIRDGVLVGFLSDRRTALEAGVSVSTGAGWRSAEGGIPAVRPGCLILRPGSQVAPNGSTGRVVRVVQANGALSANELTGDFTVGADAVVLDPDGGNRNAGRITLSGNLFAMLQNLIGHDGRIYVRQWGPTFYASPGIYVNTVTIRR